MKEGLTPIWKGSGKREKKKQFSWLYPTKSSPFDKLATDEWMNEWVKSFLYNLVGTMSTCPAPCSPYLPPDDVSAIGRGSVETSPPASGCGWEKSPCWWVREGWLLAFLISLQCTVAWSLITILSNTMIAKCYLGPSKKWLSAGTSAKCLGVTSPSVWYRTSPLQAAQDTSQTVGLRTCWEVWEPLCPRSLGVAGTNPVLEGWTVPAFAISP